VTADSLALRWLSMACFTELKVFQKNVAAHLILRRNQAFGKRVKDKALPLFILQINSICRIGYIAQATPG